jgi:hypothetical protein
MAKVTVQECRQLDAFDFGSGSCRAALEGTGGPVSGSIVWRVPLAGHELASIGFVVRRAEVELDYLRRLVSADPVTYSVPVELASGGRAFFRCPGRGCGRRVRHLYNYGGYFRCRYCHDLCCISQLLRPVHPSDDAGEVSPWASREGAGEGRSFHEIVEARIQETIRKEEQAWAEQERQRRRRYVQHTGRPGRPKEKRHYRHDGSRKVKLGPREACCCRCRTARPYRYPRRAELGSVGSVTGEGVGGRVAIRVHCRVCNSQVFRIVRTEEAKGLQRVICGLRGGREIGRGDPESSVPAGGG